MTYWDKIKNKKHCVVCGSDAALGKRKIILMKEPPPELLGSGDLRRVEIRCLKCPFPSDFISLVFETEFLTIERWINS